MAEKNYEEIFVEIIKISGGAVRVSDSTKEDWIPKSLIRDWNDDDFEEGEEVSLDIETWFLEKEGWL